MPDAELQKLEQLAIEHDQQAVEQLDSAQEPEPAQPEADKETPTGEQTTPDNSETETEKKAERPRDEKGRFTKTEDGTDIPEAERKPAEDPKAKLETPYDKAKKDKERQDRSWQALEEEKRQVRAKADEIERMRQQLQQRQQQPAEQQQRRLPYSSQELSKAAHEAEAQAIKALKDGDYDKHGERLDLSHQLRTEAENMWRAEAQEAQKKSFEQHSSVWNANLQRAFQAEPDLGKMETPIAKAVYDLLGSRRPELMVNEHFNIFEAHPYGPQLALDYAKKQLEAASASELRDKLKKAEAEVQRLNKATTPLGGVATTPSSGKTFDQLTTDEQLAYLERAAQRVDSEAFA